MVLKILKLIEYFAIVRYPGFFICLLTIIFGIILSNKHEEIGRVRQFMGCVIAIAGALIEFFMPIIVTFIPTMGAYIASEVGILIIRFISTILAFKMFSGYKHSTWVIVLFVIILLVFTGRTYYFSKILYDMTNMMKVNSNGIKAFFDLFNNKNALNVITILSVIVPPISIYVDAFGTSKKVEE